MSFTDMNNPHTSCGRLTFVDGKLCLRNPDDPISPIPLSEKMPSLLAWLKAKGYHKLAINEYKRIEREISSMERRDIEYYNELLNKYPAGDNRSYIIHCLMFDFFDEFPSSVKMMYHSAYYQLSLGYQKLIDSIVDSLRGVKRNSTINAEASSVSALLLFLQRRKIPIFEKAKEKDIRDYAKCGKTGVSVLSRIGNILSTYFENNNNEKAIKVCRFFPQRSYARKIYPALTCEEQDTLEAFLLDSNSPISKRDRAICILLFYLGIRSEECRRLTINDIDWETNTISINQIKTNNKLTLPLIPVVGNAIRDYLAERPAIDSDILFVTNKIRANKSVMVVIYSVVNNVYSLAGIRKGEKRMGAHLLRHNLADRMLASGSEITVVQTALGHVRTKTTYDYLTSQIEQLRSCSLSIIDYPIKHVLYENTERMV